MKMFKILLLTSLVSLAIPGLAAANEVHWAKVTLEMPGMSGYVASHPRVYPLAFAILKDKQYRIELPVGAEEVDVTAALSPILFPDGGIEPVDGMIIVILDAALFPHVIELPCSTFKPGDEVLPGVFVIGVGGDESLSRIDREHWAVKVAVCIPTGEKNAADDDFGWGGIKALYR